MPNIPAPEKFDNELESWSQYVDRVNFYLLASHVTEKDKLPTFLSLLSRDNYSTLCKLLSPEHPSSKSYSEIIEVLNNYFKPKILIPLERFRFIRRKQELTESIMDFVKALRHLSTNCEYGDTIALDNRLCEQFVYGLNSTKIRTRLLTEEKISFSDAIKLALTAETAIKGAQEFTSESSATNVLLHSKDSRPSSHGKKSSSKPNKDSCIHCGFSNHKSSECRLKNAVCNSCGIRGHISPICKSKKKKNDSSSSKTAKSRSVNALDVNFPETHEDDVYFNFNSVSLNYANDSSSQPIMLDIKINGVMHKIQLDTGAAVSIIPFSFYSKYLKKCTLYPTNLVLNTLRERIKPIGKVSVLASYKNNNNKSLELIVIEDPSICLIGLTWIKPLDILNQLNSNPVLPIVSQGSSLKTDHLNLVLSKYKRLFSSQLGQFKDIEVKLSLKENSSPKFFKARQVPFAIKEAVEAELVKLQSQNIISPVQHSDWAAPIVVIRKKDKSLRICGDYKVGLNPSLNVDQYPLPIIDDIFAQLNGGTVFSKLDLSQAYQQLRMDEFSQSLLTINTHKGLFRVHRMPFGIAPAPAIFQQKMDQLLGDLKGVICYLDDILVTGKGVEDHCSNLDAVLHRLDCAGITLNESKCEFLQDQVEYLGHVIDGKGLHASPSKVSSIVEAPSPKDVSQLRSFLGLIGYYRKFLPNLASVLAPLNNLLQKDSIWLWDSTAETAFNQVKAAITSTSVLTHFDPKLQISLACDASPSGLGAVISHIFPDLTERPIAFASRSLSPAEKNYSQLDKEALGLLFGVKKFHQYLFGRKFILMTDHKPLTRIFGPKSEIPTLAAARLQRWALSLSAYSYDIKYRCSKDNANADALSRSPTSSILKIHVEEESDDSLLMAHLDSFPVNDRMVAKDTLKDPILLQVLRYTKDGWPSTTTTKELEPFRSRCEEITIQDGCLLWGLRVIIPSSLRALLLQELHRHHTGIVQMKMIARGYFWWPKLDEDINVEAKSCPECAFHANNPAKAPIHPWVWPTKPWDRIHVDFAGPFMGHNFLIVVDAHSKWPEVIPMNSTATDKTLTALGSLISRYGLPCHLVSDNGPQFTSDMFKSFCKHHAIKHSFSSPYHPSSNGQAERFVQTFKKSMKKSQDKLSISDRIHQLLYAYRSTPHSTTRQTPALLFLGRELRTRLELLRPSVQRVVRDAQEKMLFSRQDPDSTRSFIIGQKVLARDYLHPNIWSEGIIYQQMGPLTYQVRLPDGQYWKRHIDQLRDANIIRRLSNSADSSSSSQDTVDFAEKIPTNVPVDPSAPKVVIKSQPSSPVKVTQPYRRRSKRIRKSSKRYV